MPTHSSLTGADLHEPKGVETASANQVYVSDSGVSGVWTDTSSIVGAAEYGGIILANNAGVAISTIGTTAQKVTVFDEDMPSNTVVPDSTTDSDITVVTAGTYITHFTASFSTAAAGDAGLYQFRLRVNDVEPSTAGASLGMYRQMSGTADTGSGGFMGIITCAANDVMTIWVESDNGSDTDDLNVLDMAFAVELLKAT